MNKLVILIIILIILAGGYYFFAMREEKESEQAPSAAEETAAIAEVSASTEVPAIEQELQVTELGNLDKEFADINTEIEGALQEAGL